MRNLNGDRDSTATQEVRGQLINVFNICVKVIPHVRFQTIFTEREGGIQFSDIQRFKELTCIITFLTNLRKRSRTKKLVKLQETEESLSGASNARRITTWKLKWVQAALVGVGQQMGSRKGAF